MYEQYYGLNEKPFNLTPDTDFYFNSLTHQDALNVLLTALQNGDGFIKITGEVGTGKTLLCRKLLDLLDDQYQTVYIPNPYLSCSELLQAVAAEMGLQTQGPNNNYNDNYLAPINAYLIENAKAGKRTVIVLDEAQSLPVESLEAIRLLSNLETQKDKLVQIVLFGQPELDQHLSNSSIRQLKQRISHAYTLQQLAPETINRYVMHRLRAAGYCGVRVFTEDAIKLLCRLTQGVPRLINLLCHKSLMLAYASGEFHVTPSLLQQAAKDSEHNLQSLAERTEKVAAA